MKFLIQDYSTLFHTEPKYFNHILNSIEGCSSVLWSVDNPMSVYDIMDTVKPNIVITHASLVPKDLIIYLSEHSNIELILNISGVTSESLSNIEKVFTTYNVNCSLCFVNYGEHYHASSKFNIVSIYHGVDLFLPVHTNVSYNVDKLYLTNSATKIVDDCSYHVISNNANIKDHVDIIMSVYDLGGIYNNYDHICLESFPNKSIVPQLFFDAVHYGKYLQFNFTKDHLQEICRILKIDNLKDINKVKQAVKDKHTCFNRTKSLLSQLRCTDLVNKLSIIMKDV